MALSKDALKLLDLDADFILKNENDLAEYLCGNKLPEKSKVFKFLFVIYFLFNYSICNKFQPMASNYCGFQFGNWAN